MQRTYRRLSGKKNKEKITIFEHLLIFLLQIFLKYIYEDYNVHNNSNLTFDSQLEFYELSEYTKLESNYDYKIFKNDYRFNPY